MAQVAGMADQFRPNSSRRDDWQTIGLVGTAHASSHFFQLVIPSLFVPLGATFGLDFVALGFLMTLFFVVSGVGQVISGFVVDRVGAHPVLWFGVACFVLSALLLSVATGYPMLLVAALVGGTGNAVFHPADFSILNHRVHQTRLGHAFSLHNITGTAGWALAPVFVMGLTALLGWRYAALGVAVLMALVLLAVWWGRSVLLVPGTRTQTDPQSAQPLAADAKAVHSNGVLVTVQKLLRSPALCGSFLFFCCATVSMSAVQNYTIPLMGSQYGMTALAAGSVISAYMVGNMLGTFAGGFMVNVSRRTEIVVCVALILSASMFWLMASGTVPVTLAAAVIALAGFFVGVSTPSRDMMVRRVAPKSAVGSVYGLVYSGLDVGSAIGPVLFGLLLDYGWVRAPWYGAGTALITGAMLAVYIGRHSVVAPAAASR